MQQAGGVQRPLLLVVVCRPLAQTSSCKLLFSHKTCALPGAFLSRRLLQSLRQHLPQASLPKPAKSPGVMHFADSCSSPGCHALPVPSCHLDARLHGGGNRRVTADITGLAFRSRCRSSSPRSWRRPRGCGPRRLRGERERFRLRFSSLLQGPGPVCRAWSDLPRGARPRWPGRVPAFTVPAESQLPTWLSARSGCRRRPKLRLAVQGKSAVSDRSYFSVPSATRI